MNLQCSSVSRLNGKLSCFTWLAVPNAMHSDCEWRLRTIQRRLLFIYFLCTHTDTHILRYTRTFLHRTTRRRITTCWYLDMVLASDKHCGMLLVSRTECSVAISPLPSPSSILIGRLTTLSANVKCSCSGPGSLWVAFGGKLLFGLNARSHDCSSGWQWQARAAAGVGISRPLSDITCCLSLPLHTPHHTWCVSPGKALSNEQRAQLMPLAASCLVACYFLLPACYAASTIKTVNSIIHTVASTGWCCCWGPRLRLSSRKIISSMSVALESVEKGIKNQLA